MNIAVSMEIEHQFMDTKSKFTQAKPKHKQTHTHVHLVNAFGISPG